MSQPENGDVTLTASQLRFNLAEEAVWNVITAIHTGRCVCSGVCLFPTDVCVCVMFNTFHLSHVKNIAAGEQPKMAAALTTLNRMLLMIFPKAAVFITCH